MTFDVIAEIEPPVNADAARVDAQVASWRSVAPSFLVPDNHTSRATVSSLVVAGELARRDLHAVACLNARDRNLLGLHRDLLTARYLGVDELLLVHGDEPAIGGRSGDLSVRTMLDECAAAGLHRSVTTRVGPLAGWKHAADRLFVQVTWSMNDLLRWRDAVRFEGPVYAGVMVLPSASMARRLGERVPELRVPDTIVDDLERDPTAGVRHAVDAIRTIRRSGAFAGVHLVAGVRHRELAEQLSLTLERTVQPC